MNKKKLLISLVSREQILKEPHGRNIISLFFNDYTNLIPQTANFYEPINKTISTLEEALEYWEGNPGLYRRKNNISGSWYISTNSRPSYQKEEFFYSTFEYNWNNKVEWFGLFKKLLVLSKSFFAYVHVFTNEEMNYFYEDYARNCFSIGIPPSVLKNGVPQLGWANYFGEEYVKELDLTLIKQHSFEINPLGEGYVFNITDKIEDVITDYDHFNARRQELKALFRPGLFQNYARYEHESKPIAP